MDLATASALVDAHLQPGVDPTLTVAEVAVVLDEMRMPDASNVAPSNPAWIPTYSRHALAGALVLGWEMKAAKAVADVNHTEDGATFAAGQLHEHCQKQIASWRKRIVAGVPLVRSVV